MSHACVERTVKMASHLSGLGASVQPMQGTVAGCLSTPAAGHSHSSALAEYWLLCSLEASLSLWMMIGQPLALTYSAQEVCFRHTHSQTLPPKSFG